MNEECEKKISKITNLFLQKTKIGENKEEKTLEKPIILYNIEVKDNHNYFVGLEMSNICYKIKRK